MKVNQATVDLVKRWEGLRLEAYRDAVGVWTIGYGHSEKAGYGPKPVAGMVITEGEAEELLRKGLERFARGVAEKLYRKPTENQFGAMVSLAYNIGLGAFGKSTCLKRFNAGDMEGAAEALTWFNKAGGKVLRGLVRRREEERDLFLSEHAQPEAVKPDAEKTPARSKSLWALMTGGSGFGYTAFQFWQQLETWEKAVALLVALSIAYAMRERLLKLAQGI